MIGEFKVRMSSAEYGVDSFGPYGTIEEARAVCARLRIAINLLDDGVRREVRISFGTRGRRQVLRGVEAAGSQWDQTSLKKL